MLDLNPRSCYWIFVLVMGYTDWVFPNMCRADSPQVFVSIWLIVFHCSHTYSSGQSPAALSCLPYTQSRCPFPTISCLLSVLLLSPVYINPSLSHIRFQIVLLCKLSTHLPSFMPSFIAPVLFYCFSAMLCLHTMPCPDQALSLHPRSCQALTFALCCWPRNSLTSMCGGKFVI